VIKFAAQHFFKPQKKKPINLSSIGGFPTTGCRINGIFFMRNKINIKDGKWGGLNNARNDRQMALPFSSFRRHNSFQYKIAFARNADWNCSAFYRWERRAAKEEQNINSSIPSRKWCCAESIIVDRHPAQTASGNSSFVLIG